MAMWNRMTARFWTTTDDKEEGCMVNQPAGATELRV